MTESRDDSPQQGESTALPRHLKVAAAVVSIALGLFIFYTSFFGAFETLIQRAIFVALVTVLGLLMFPLGLGRPWRPLGALVDTAIGGLVIAAAVYVIYHFETIMTELPFATSLDLFLGYGTLLVILELARRSASLVFPVLVGLMVAYAFLGHLIPGSLGHRELDSSYIAEVIFLSDRGLWGMLVGIASTTLAAFVLFGSLLLHSGVGQTFFDLSARAGGSSPGGAAKIATVASGLFGAISGSSVANIATTGNFTIPLMKRLRYPSALAGGVEAIASTGGQLAPPIMGTAAFVMAELVGMNYWKIALAALLPAVLLYVGIFMTVHFIARRGDYGRMSADELPDWRSALNWRRLAPLVAAIVGLGIGIARGNSIELTACFGMIGIIGAYAVASLTEGVPLRKILTSLSHALQTGGRGIVIVGILLIAAQVFVAMINLTGVGVTITNAILSVGGDNIWLIAIIMAFVCLIAGMGLPTSAAYVLVAAVFAPALIQQGLDALTVHLFVLYYAALSVVTPPVCVGVFVAAMIADCPWIQVAKYALRLGATAYVMPFLFLLYPGLIGQGGTEAVLLALVSGLGFILAAASFFAASPVIGRDNPSWALWLLPMGLTLYGEWWTSLAGAALTLAMFVSARRAAPPAAPRDDAVAGS
ncbi:TRAP transporter permease [Halomonas borealis]|uniref:TRAP transporter permease n=1 Tax=Halomonas borealis TaxID=2508710 RepID=UPI0010A07F14|nr:TRAP transporter fused permease subunit [Halomonas borealis]